LAVTLSAFAAGIAAARLLLGTTLDLPFRPDWASLAALSTGAILVTVGAALLAALPALTARPASALRAL
ncbi:MAG: hypothetical protein M3N06_07160, partial [Pseudomonadota bacterium]|nr:hypothetical protein [Pseudomonadota bacterium]